MHAKNINTKEPKIGRPGFRIIKRKKLGAILAEKRSDSIKINKIKKKIEAEFRLDIRVGAVAKIVDVRKRIKQMLEEWFHKVISL